MKTPRNYKNIRVFAVKSVYNDGFDLYLDFSGQREFLMGYNYNGLIFSYFRDGKTLADLYRWHPKQMSYQAGRKMESSMNYIMRRIEEFINDREFNREFG